jgi:hypothetical protein
MAHGGASFLPGMRPLLREAKTEQDEVPGSGKDGDFGFGCPTRSVCCDVELAGGGITSRAALGILNEHTTLAEISPVLTGPGGVVRIAIGVGDSAVGVTQAISVASDGPARSMQDAVPRISSVSCSTTLEKS